MASSEDPFSIYFKGEFQGIPKRNLPDDCVEYSLHVVNPPLNTNIETKLSEVKNLATKLTDEWADGYIWQREGFNLELVHRKDGLPFLRGRTAFGDAIDDEWFIVAILRELSRRFTDLWISVVDTDGQFLLIAAANALPTWVQPETADNRVWINSGNLLLVDGTKAPGNITLAEALCIISGQREQCLVRISLVEEEAFYQIRNYPETAKNNIHYAIAKVPRKIALILKNRPEFVSSAVEQFYLRDSISLKACKTMKVFDPKDSVDISVRFSNLLYAQLRCQEFEPPTTAGFSIPLRKLGAPQTKAFIEADVGMKLACGFEMLLSTKRLGVGREDKIAEEIRSLLEREQLPIDAEIDTWPKRDDSDSWLDINYLEFEQDLKGKSGNKSGLGEASGYGDKEQEAKLKKLVERFEAFMNDEQAGMEGVDFEDDEDEDDSDEETDDDGEDKAISFDEEEFEKMMREMMGLPTEAPTTELAESARETQQTRNDEHHDIEEVMEQVEKELKEAGVFEPLEKPRIQQLKDDDETCEEDLADDELHINYNLAMHLLESFKSQGGLSGPGGNLLASLGISLPRDEGDQERTIEKGKKRLE